MKATLVPWVRWMLLYLVATLIVSRLALMHDLRISHGVLMYLLLVVGASREGGRWLAASMVVLSYVAVDYFFVPPRGAIGQPTHRDMVVLIGFVITAGVIAQLLVSLRQAATTATERAVEIERLSVERLALERDAARADVLQEAERLKNALITSLSHDLRSPIMAMTMLSDPATGIPVHDAMARLREQIRQLSEFLSTLDRFATSGDREKLLHVETHAVDDLNGAALRASESVLQHHRVLAPSPPDGSVLLVRCDFTLTLQILGNLLQNAARYSEPGTLIEIGSAVEGDRIRITVSDRGTGVAATDAESIFRPMWRGAEASERLGSGMGLSIARTFARAQGGDVVFRPRENGGSHFDLYLPEAPMPATAEPALVTTANAGGVTV
jgi:K+-sensing histidine kinase KdpD